MYIGMGKILHDGVFSHVRRDGAMSCFIFLNLSSRRTPYLVLEFVYQKSYSTPKAYLQQGESFANSGGVHTQRDMELPLNVLF